MQQMQMQWGAVKLSRLLENCPDKRPYYQHLTAPVYVGLCLHLHVCTSENQPLHATASCYPFNLSHTSHGCLSGIVRDFSSAIYI